MNILIENEKYKAEICTLGAEIHSLTSKADGTEYIWNGEPSVWKSHAPILFPFVARCLDNHFMIEGKRCEYTKNHGFARDLETKVILQEKSKVVFELTESDQTLYRYPYKFSLKTEYELTDDGLNWKITVKNNDEKTFKFSVGTHAAFCCPRNTDPAGTENSDYVVEFENREKLISVLCNENGFLAADKDGNAPCTAPYNEAEPGIIPLTKDGFGNGHLFTNFTSNWVGLRNKKDNSLISIETKGFPYCMIWQNTAGAPSFICIEPWHGVADAENTNHIWEEKFGLNDLAPGKEFICQQNIKITK